VTLIFGVGLMLVWAGFVEAFLSQYHEPFVPYWAKISFGALSCACLHCSLPGRAGVQLRTRNSNPGTDPMRNGKTNTLLIRTPEGIIFSLLLAGPVTRFLAWAIDMAAISATCSVMERRSVF